MSSAELEVQGIGESEWSEVELQLTEEGQLEEDLEEDSNSNNNNKAALLAFKKRKRSLCEKTGGGGGGTGEMAWDIRRRRQNEQKRRNNSIHDCNDEDLRELRGCIELGFGFNEEDGQTLCNTLPALDLYFAVNRHLIISTSSPISTPPIPTPRTINHSRSSSSIGSSPSSTTADSESWKICSPGDDPAQIKTKLRHWAQAVACSVMQSHN